MKISINDWNYDMENFKMNIEENKEYQINTWITTRDNRRLYLMSAYLYDEFVMFFYIYEYNSHEYDEWTEYKVSKTRRDSIMKSGTNNNSMSFEYEVNYLKQNLGRGNEYNPHQRKEIITQEKQDEFFETYYSSHDYLCDIVKSRLPEELQGVALAFRKDSYSFTEPVTEINHIAIYPSNRDIRTHLVDKTFTLPLGECDTKIPYTAYGTQSYIIVRELKIVDMLEWFERHYDEFKKIHENNLRESEQNKIPENQTPIDLEELRSHWDKRILTISYIKPEEDRLFEFYTTEYLDSEIPKVTNGIIAEVYYFAPDKDDRMSQGLYKSISAVGEIHDNPKSEYEITLMKVSQHIKHERNAVLEITF